MGGTCSTYGRHQNAHNIWVGEPEKKRHLRIPRRRRVDNIEIDLKGIRFRSVGSFRFSQGRDQQRPL
jgi:hypothetical protein